VARAKDGYLPWSSRAALDELKKSLKRHAVNWEIAADFRGEDDPAAPVATVLKALVGALDAAAAGDGKPLRGLGSSAKTILAELRRTVGPPSADEVVAAVEGRGPGRPDLDDPRPDRPNEAEQLGQAMEGWLRAKYGAKEDRPAEIARYFVAHVTSPGQYRTLRAQLRDAGVDVRKHRHDDDVKKTVAAAFRRLPAVTTPAGYVRSGLTAMGCPVKIVEGLFSFEKQRRRRRREPGG
jgi:hypothetical protein